MSNTLKLVIKLLLVFIIVLSLTVFVELFVVKTIQEIGEVKAAAVILAKQEMGEDCTAHFRGFGNMSGQRLFIIDCVSNTTAKKITYHAYMKDGSLQVSFGTSNF